MRFTKEIQERIRERADNYTEKARHNKMISVKDSYCDGIIEVLDNPLEYDLITANTKERGLIELALERHIDSLKNRFENESGIVHPAKKYEELLEKIQSLNL